MLQQLAEKSCMKMKASGKSPNKQKINKLRAY